ncbi:unnamed protein product [Clonostachys rosea]|uniref:Uncharacterized protein n=1 Tax=Bionectria ochroleuca TaxID=29856 RepID=A0ABY6U5W1_BIOOC|nr:unnamed protein product [Clonostachys rosea]
MAWRSLLASEPSRARRPGTRATFPEMILKPAITCMCISDQRSSIFATATRAIAVAAIVSVYGGLVKEDIHVILNALKQRL